MNLRFLVLVFVVFFFSLPGCKNNDQLFKTVIYGNVNVINATADTLNFYLNGTRQNNASSLFPDAQSFYLSEPSGPQNYQFKKAGSASVLFSLPLTIPDSVNFSIYLAGETADKSFHTVDYLDTTGINDGVSAKIRFVNASPDAGTLNVSVGDTVGFKSAIFESTSPFQLIGSGIKIVKIYPAGAVVPHIDTVILQPSHIYTLYSKGLINGKGSAAFGIGLAINLALTE